MYSTTTCICTSYIVRFRVALLHCAGLGLTRENSSSPPSARNSPCIINHSGRRRRRLALLAGYGACNEHGHQGCMCICPNGNSPSIGPLQSISCPLDQRLPTGWKPATPTTTGQYHRDDCHPKRNGSHHSFLLFSKRLPSVWAYLVVGGVIAQTACVSIALLHICTHTHTHTGQSGRGV